MCRNCTPQTYVSLLYKGYNDSAICGPGRRELAKENQRGRSIDNEAKCSQRPSLAEGRPRLARASVKSISRKIRGQTDSTGERGRLLKRLKIHRKSRSSEFREGTKPLARPIPVMRSPAAKHVVLVQHHIH